MRAARTTLDGLLVVDKPVGPTSHDVVAGIRRRLGTRRVGHAGTLDPLASGVLVVLVGEATKLVPFLALDEKRYEASVLLGVATTTGDAEGEPIDQQELPAWFADEAERTAAVDSALARERARTMQSPPLYSAIKVGGRSAHRLARAGEAVELDDRPVAVHELERVRIEMPTRLAPGAVARLELRLRVSKGYYVRALARDLGEALGIPAHLGSLRRTASGRFDLDRAVSSDATADELDEAMVSLAEAAALTLPVAVLTATGTVRARRGQRLAPEHFASGPTGPTSSAWLDATGTLVALGEIDLAGGGRVLRGFAGADP